MVKSVSSNQSSVPRQCLPVIDKLDGTVMRFIFNLFDHKLEYWTNWKVVKSIILDEMSEGYQSY